MKRTLLALTAVAALSAGGALADERDLPKSGHLDHVLLIMMENHAAAQIVGNPNAPFLTGYAKTTNFANNYWAVGHPSLSNYLEVIGGSNFAVTDDFWPDWVNGGCVDNAGGTGCDGAVTPIAGTGMDVADPATVDPSNPQLGLPPGTPPTPNNWALRNYAAARYVAKTIAHQLVETSRSWKTYQESLPTMPAGVDGVNYADGTYSNLSPAAVFSTASVQRLYAVKHNPFVYFKDVQQGRDDGLSLSQVVDFDGPNGLWADLGSGEVPNFAFIAPNQCHDMHGAGGGSAFCTQDPTTVQMGDAEVKKLVTGIKASKAWHEGRNAIIVMWDENDYANQPNRVALFVETNYGVNGRASSVAYDHYSLTKTLEAGFGLPCLNHACDKTSKVMSDLFDFAGE